MMNFKNVSLAICLTLYGSFLFAAPRYCPEIRDIRFSQKSTWFVPGEKWQSSTFSFSKGLRSFVGAYWIGAEYGVVTCLYEPTKVSGKEVFDVELMNSDLFSPEVGNMWVYQPKTSRYYCYSKTGSTRDCPFYAMGEEMPLTEEQLFDQLRYNFSTADIS